MTVGTTPRRRPGTTSARWASTARAAWAVFGDKNLNTPSQDEASALGALVRVVPLADGGPGDEVPDDNPYSADSSKNGAVYAKGLRSPWRATLDSHGRWFVGDVGGALIEEVDMVSAPGQNFGWPLHEGACAPDCGDTVPPLIAWDRTLTHRSRWRIRGRPRARGASCGSARSTAIGETIATAGA